VILVCASLSSCALLGVYGPERKQIAQENLRKIPGLLAQLPQATANDLSAFGGGSGADPSMVQLNQQLNRIQQDADWNQMLLRHQLQSNEMQAEGAAIARENQAQWQRQMQQNQAQWDQFNERARTFNFFDS